MTDTAWSTTDYFGSSIGVFSNGNLTVDRTGGANWITGRATNSRNSLKRHYEITIGNHIPWATTGSQARIGMGIMDGTKTLSGNLWEIGSDGNGREVFPNGVTSQCSGLTLPWIPGNGVLAVEYDSVNQKVWFGTTGFCTWNPNTWFSNSLGLASLVTGLKIERNGGSSNWVGGTATAKGATGGYGSGLLMFEVTVNATPSSNLIVGAATSAVNFVGTLTFPGNDTTKGFGYQSNGTTFGCGGITMPAMASGDVISVCLDYTNGKGWILNSSNGLWNNAAIGSQNPATNTGGFTLPSGTLLPSCAFFASSIPVTLNAGSSAFTTTLPSGFSKYEPGTFLWNGDVLANQNPATATGGISTSGIATTSIYPAWSCHDNTNDQTANFDASTFTRTPSVGFTGWDARQSNSLASQTAVCVIT